MKPIEIVSDDDERLFIPFTVKGVEFRVPRFDAIDIDTYKSVLDELAKIDADSEVPAYERRRLTTLRLLREFVTDDQFQVLLGLKLVQLDDIMSHWVDLSGVSLGELLSSSPISTGSTEALSSSISSPTSESGAET